ncbi:MAG: hypothetical protein AMXMBFR12_07260 [Candidatus Babeliales bacterium]
MDNSAQFRLVTEFVDRARELQQLKDPHLYFSLLPHDLIKLTGQYYISANNNQISFHAPSYEKWLKDRYKAEERKQFYYSLIAGSLKIAAVGISCAAVIVTLGYLKDLPVSSTEVIAQEPAQKNDSQAVHQVTKPIEATPSAVPKAPQVPVAARVAYCGQNLWAQAQRLYPLLRMQGRHMSPEQIYYLLSQGIDPLRASRR